MIYVGENEITNIYIGADEIYGIYAGDLQIYPTDFGNVTAITISGLTWVTDVSANGGTADSGNCSFDVYAFYDSGKKKRVTRDATVSGSLVVSATTAATREMVGTLTLTATYSGFTDSDSVDVYQKPQTYSNLLVYTTTDGNQLSKDFSSYAWVQNYISHTFSNGTGIIAFDDDLTAIPDGVFSGCTTLETITIPITVTSYGYRTFYNCSGMSEFLISSAITSIGTSCFYECSGVLTIESPYAAYGDNSTIDNAQLGFAYKWTGSWGNDGFGSSEYHLNFSKIIITGETVTAVTNCAFHTSPVNEIIIGDNVKTIGSMAFGRMQGGDSNARKQAVLNKNPLLTLTVGSGLTDAHIYWLFYGPESLTRINYYPPNYSATSNNAWYGSTREASVHYREGSTGRMSLPSWFTIYYDL